MDSHCNAGHERTRENTRVVATRDGYIKRHCRECEAARSRKRYAEIAAAARERGRW